MTKKLLNAMVTNANVARTKNNAKVYKTSEKDVLDFFDKISAMRNETEVNIVKLFTNAFSENPLLTLKALFYNRDIRGGAGERRTSKIILKYMAEYYPQIIVKNIDNIVKFGRYDDLYELFNSRIEKDAIEYIANQLKEDMKSDYPSLLAKWLKSENASSITTKKLATKTRIGLKLSSKEYRKMLSYLRNKINIVETAMSQQKWDSIEFDKLPSKAGLKYRKSFFKHQETRYSDFIASLKANKEDVKVNVATLYPYEIIHAARNEHVVQQSELLEEMWKRLPDYINGNKMDCLAICDTSWSMGNWSYYNNKKFIDLKYKPIDAAIAMTMYIAERVGSAWKNFYINFNDKAKLYAIKGTTLKERINSIYSNNDWGGSTNIVSAFELILNTAIKYKLSNEDMIKRLIIISDMQFNACTNSNKMLFKSIKQQFNDAGYDLPAVTFWNVNAIDQDFSIVKFDEINVQMVSGYHTSILKNILTSTTTTPYDFMLEVLNNERYNSVVI